MMNKKRTAILILVLLGLVFGIIWISQFISGSVKVTTDSEDAGIFILDKEGNYEEVGIGTATIRKNPGDYTVVARDGTAETIITTKLEYFKHKKVTVSLIEPTKPVAILDTWGRNIIAQDNLLHFLDPANDVVYESIIGINKSIDLLPHMSVFFAEVHWLNFNEAVMQGREGHLVHYRSGHTKFLNYPDSANDEEEAGPGFAVPFGVNSDGKAAMIVNRALYYYDNLDGFPRKIVQNVNDSSVLAVNSFGDVLYGEQPAINEDSREEEVSVPSRIVVVSGKDGAVISEEELAKNEQVLSLTWNPEGNKYVYGTDRGLYITDTGTKETRQLLVQSPGEVSSVEWVNDHIYFVLANQVWRLSNETGEFNKMVEHAPGIALPYSLYISPDETRGFFSLRDPEKFRVGAIYQFEIK